LGVSLSEGFEKFQKRDDAADEHLDSLLKTIAALEEKEGKRCEADVVTWRGMMTKV
jgi:RAT1-interacting protein